MAANITQSSGPNVPVHEAVDSPTLATQPNTVDQGMQHPQAEDSAAHGMMIDSQTQKDGPPDTTTPEPLADPREDAQNLVADASPNAPGHVPSFDWDLFEERFEAALDAANTKEREILEEFDSLVKYFNVWASTSSAHDIDRGRKRLHTREKFVMLKEQSLSEKKQHLIQVVKAFQDALALLAST